MSEKQSHFDYEFFSCPDYGFLIVQLKSGQTISAEASAMASMDTNIKMKTKIKGGLIAGMKRKLAGESLFINEFTAQGGGGEVTFAPASIGDLKHYRIKPGRALFTQSSAYVASAPTVEVKTKWQGLKKGFFSGAGLFLVRLEGEGDVFFNSYGALMEIPVDGNFVIDSSYIAAFEEGLEYETRLLKNFRTSIFSQEGFVCHFRGKGKVWVQTRNTPFFTSWINPFRPVQSSSD